MTPSKRLQNHFKKFTDLLKPLYSKCNLNASKPKHNPYGGDDGWGSTTQGVKSDLIYIYNPVISYFDGNPTHNFAFVFTYEGKEESEQTIRFQMKKYHRRKYDESDAEKESRLKVNDSILDSKEFSIDEFKEKMNTLNSILESESLKDKLTETFILDALKAVFFEENIDVLQEKNKAKKAIYETKRQLKEKIETTEKEIGRIKKDVESSLSLIDTKIEEMDEIKEISELNNRISELRKVVTATRNKMLAEHQISSKQQSISDKKANLKKLKNRLIKS